MAASAKSPPAPGPLGGPALAIPCRRAPQANRRLPVGQGPWTRSLEGMSLRTAPWILLAMVAGCGGGADSSAPQPGQVVGKVLIRTSAIDTTARVVPSDTGVVGAVIQLYAIAVNEAGGILSGRTATWSSSAPAVATVSSAGIVTSKSFGQTTVTASVDGVSGFETISFVQPLPAAPVIDLTGPESLAQVNGTAVPFQELLSVFDGGLVRADSQFYNTGSMTYNPDGTFRLSFTVRNKTFVGTQVYSDQTTSTTWTGNWSLAGNTLTLSFTDGGVARTLTGTAGDGTSTINVTSTVQSSATQSSVVTHALRFSI